MEWDRPRSSEIPGREDRKGGQGGALKELRRHPEGHQGPRHVLGELAGRAAAGGRRQQRDLQTSEGNCFPSRCFTQTNVM